jgi:hypothetical protein
MPLKEYGCEVREHAKELYLVDGLTFEQVAEATGVSLSQLKRWSAEEKEWEEGKGQDWPEGRKEFRLALSCIRRDSVLLRGKLIGNALTSNGDFKHVLAAGIWEKTQAHPVGASRRLAQGDPPGRPYDLATEPEPGAMPVIKTPADAVAALEAVLINRIALLASRPELLNFTEVKDLQKTMGLMEELQAKYRPGEPGAQAQGLSDAAAEEIRRQILGGL